MNILIITYLFDPEPIVMSTITKDLATILSKEHNVTVLTSRPCRPYGYKFEDKPLIDNKWPFKRIIMDSYTHPKSEFKGRMKENVSFGKEAVKYIEEHVNEIDAIYLNVFPLFAQKYIINAASKHHIRVINHIEDVYPEPFRENIPYIGSLVYRFLLPIDRKNVNKATCSVVIGNKIKDYYIKTRKTEPSKVAVVYNWQDESRFSGVFPYPQCGFTFLYAGSVSKATGLQTVIEAFGESGVVNARLVIAGSGTEKEAFMKVAEQYPNAQIEFCEAPVERIAEIQASADVLVLPLKKYVSLRAVPSKFAAYLMSKRAVLAIVECESDVADIINRSGCGWVATTGDKEDMIRAFKEASKTDKHTLETMGKSGSEYYYNNLTKDINLNRLAEIVTGY